LHRPTREPLDPVVGRHCPIITGLRQIRGGFRAEQELAQEFVLPSTEP
jgi:hypothetical protein